MGQATRALTTFDNQCWPNSGVIAPCRNACPVGTDPAAYIMAILMEDYDAAFRAIALENPLPGICGRLCHHPCEEKCVRTKIDSPVAIRALKRFAIERAGRKTFEEFIPVAKKTGRRVAVVGSGPAGLGAARDLALLGHAVTVFEKSDSPGGVPHLSIPAFVMPRNVLDDDIQRLIALGINFKTNAEIRTEKQIKALFDADNDAVLLAFGAMQGGFIPGVDESHLIVESGLSFLMRTCRRENERMGGRVLIIGGGDVAIDVARVAIRMGADSVNLFCLEARDSMPASGWEIERAEKEGLRIYPDWGLVSCTEDPDGGSQRACFARVKQIDIEEDGTFNPVLDTGELQEVGADRVILAVGQKIDLEVLKDMKYRLASRGSIITDAQWKLGDHPGLFVAGDLVINPGTVSEAIGTGKAAAASIDQFLMGEREVKPAFFGRVPQRTVKTDKEVLSIFPKQPRQRMPEIAAGDAVATFDEVTTGFSEATAMKEARRCLNCAMCSNCFMDNRRICQFSAERLWGG